MPDSLRSSGNNPGDDTHPAPGEWETVNIQESSRPSSAAAEPKVVPWPGTDARSAAANPHQNEALNRTAEKIGTLLGTMVKTARSLPRQLQAAPRNVSSMGGRLREKGGELCQDASEAAREWRHSAQARAQQARERAKQYAYENPFHVIAGAAGVAFLVGVALRAWRSRLE